jgi:hypothetical protein
MRSLSSMIVLIEESQGIFNTITGPPNCLILSPMNHESQTTVNSFKEKPENQKREKLLTSSSFVQRDYEKCLSGSDKTG